MEKIPYVHLYTDALEAMPVLARGSNAVVFMTTGLLLPKHPEGPKLQDIVNATALSVRTIQAALTLLIGSGLVIETSDGKFTPVKHIDYRRYTHCTRTPIDQSISQSNQSSSSDQELSTEKEFTVAFERLTSMLLLSGGIRSDEVEAFQTLWDECPDQDIHSRAIGITMERAERPNYKYYEAVVRSGAVVYKPKNGKGQKDQDNDFKVVRTPDGGFYA